MAYESFLVSEVVPAEPARIYAAWLNSAEHNAFTGDDASIEPFVGGKHSSFGGYSFGSTVELQPGARIVQTWRAQDFPPGTPDSRVEVTLEPTLGGTMVTIFHTEIPSGLSDACRDGWMKFYLEPLKKYFGDAPRAVKLPMTTNGVSKVSPAKLAAKAKAKAKTKTKPKTKVKAKAQPRRAPAKKVKAKAKAKPRRASPKKKPAKRATRASAKRRARKK